MLGVGGWVGVGSHNVKVLKSFHDNQLCEQSRSLSHFLKHTVSVPVNHLICIASNLEISVIHLRNNPLSTTIAYYILELLSL